MGNPPITVKPGQVWIERGWPPRRRLVTAVHRGIVQTNCGRMTIWALARYFRLHTDTDSTPAVTP